MTGGLAYVRDPGEIYRQSFATIEREANLSRYSPAMRAVAIRLVHACGMVDLLDDLVFCDGAAEAGRAALAAGRPVFCDVEMVRTGIIPARLPAGNALVCTLNDPRAAAIGRANGETRSAAAVELWDERLDGAIAVIGNAPTALFRLLERLDVGAPRPALIVGMPVGFVGAVEAKAELAANPRGAAFITIAGRRGGSALAAAAVNGLGNGAAEWRV
ncbi:MAG: precorrin-8X methylmutase [Alphaproteobacteria bacterium]|nr:MAG: precorrin-8X methylmutase [Alphaproteobacteria bacterium]